MELKGTAVKEKVVKEPSVTKMLTGVTEEHLAKFKDRSLEIAKLLAAGNSKSEILATLTAQEEANGVPEGSKPITHQMIYQVFKRLSGMDGVIIGEKPLVTFRKKKAETAAKEADVEAPATPAEEFAAATEGVVEG